MRTATSIYVLIAAALTLTCAAQCQQQWRYNLKAGDHLIYSETLERETVGPNASRKVRATFENHILILDGSALGVTVAIQRNRQSAGLVSPQRGKGPSEGERKSFDESTSKWPSRVAEANQLSPSGGLQFASSAIREWPSRALVGFEEFPLIRGAVLQSGQKWGGGGYLEAQYAVKQVDTSNDSAVALVEGSALGGHVQLKYRIGLSGEVQQAEFDAEYGIPGGTAKEHVVLTLVSVKHEQTLPVWLASGDTRLAALSALERFSTLATFADELRPVVESGDAEAVTLAVSTIARRRMQFDWASVKDPKLTVEGERLLVRLRRGEKLQPPNYAAGTMMLLYQDPERGLVPYVIRIPRDYSVDHPAPLLAYLAGGAGVALDALNNSLPAITDSEFAVLYPNALDMWWEPKSTAMFDGLLKKVVGDLHVPPEKTFVAGFSNGGSGAEFYAARWPERFGAAVSLMGAGVCGVLDDRAVEQLKRVPLLLVHGRKDKTIDPECSQQLFYRLQRKHATVRLELLDQAHDVTINSDQGLTMQFLRKTAGID